MATHKLQMTFDDSTGELRIEHRCVVELGGHKVSHSDPVVLDDAIPAIAMAKRLIDGNREEMEKRTMEAALQHAAALARILQSGVKRLELMGSVGATGDVTLVKK